MQREVTFPIFYRLLGHAGLGCTELHVLSPTPMVAYADNELEFVRLCQEMVQNGFSVHVGIQPRTIDQFDIAPNQWIMVNEVDSCKHASDLPIEYVTMGHVQITIGALGQEPSARELEKGYQVALAIANQAELKSHAVIVTADCNYHVLVPIVPIPVENPELERQYNFFWQSLISRVVHGVDRSISVTSAFHLDDTMPVIHGYYQEISQGSGLFRVKDSTGRSYELHQSILNTVVSRTDSKHPSAVSKPVKKSKQKRVDDGQMLLWPNL